MIDIFKCVFHSHAKLWALGFINLIFIQSFNLSLNYILYLLITISSFITLAKLPHFNKIIIYIISHYFIYKI